MIGFLKTLAALVVALGVAWVATMYDTVEGDTGFLLGVLWGTLAGYGVVGLAVVRNWWGWL